MYQICVNLALFLIYNYISKAIDATDPLLESDGEANKFKHIKNLDNYTCKVSNVTDDTGLSEFENIKQDQVEEAESIISDEQTSPMSCPNGWFEVSKQCYIVVSHAGRRTIESYDGTCAYMNATLAAFPTERAYLDFFKKWKTLPNFTSSYPLLGYTHDKGVADFKDIVQYYSQKKISWPSYFSKANPDFWHDNEYCIYMKPDLQAKCLNDVSCSLEYLKPVCQQMINYATRSVNCVQLCRSDTLNGHRFTTSLKHCAEEATVETIETALVFVRFLSGLTEMIYEMKSVETENTLMVYGQEGLLSLDVSYEYQRSIIVAKVQASSTMDPFVLMINPQRNDTIICKKNSDEHKYLLAQSWKVQRSFFLFSRIDGNVCMTTTVVCNWTDWKTLTTCNTTCGRGFETKIRFGTCDGKNETITVPCFVAKCKYQQKTCGQVLTNKPGVAKTTFAVESLFQCGKACNFYSWCLGVNFRPPNGKTANCELLSRNTSTATFTCAFGWSFYERF